MNLGLMNRRAAQKYLPYDAEIEYIRNIFVSSLYINYIPHANFRMIAKIAINDFGTNSNSAIIGSYTSINNKVYYISKNNNSTNSVRFEWDTKAWSNNQTCPVSIGEVLNIDCYKRVVKINSRTFNLSDRTATENTSKFMIFNRLVDTTIYELKGYDDDIPVFDFKAVRIGEKGYFYDNVNSELVGGIDGYTLGPDK